jgi:RNA polymerase sigma factor (sigma-70 family)
MSEQVGISVQGQRFVTTHWTAVLSARDSSHPDAQTLLQNLCRDYWPPLYAFIRRSGYSVEEAQDLTQEFFYRFIEKDFLQHLKDRRGKFRSFLLTLLKHFLSDQRDRSNAQKRGGGHWTISLDEFITEETGTALSSPEVTPEHEFDRRWAHTLLQHSYKRLKEDYRLNGNVILFERLKNIHSGDSNGQTCQEIGSDIGISESAVKSALHRMRKRHREILEEEIRKTVHTDTEFDEEVRYFIQVLSRKS